MRSVVASPGEHREGSARPPGAGLLTTPATPRRGSLLSGTALLSQVFLVSALTMMPIAISSRFHQTERQQRGSSWVEDGQQPVRIVIGRVRVPVKGWWTPAHAP
jgi:hypothetical protein